MRVGKIFGLLAMLVACAPPALHANLKPTARVAVAVSVPPSREARLEQALASTEQGAPADRAAGWEQVGALYTEIANAQFVNSAQESSRALAINALEHALFDAPDNLQSRRRMYWLGHAYLAAYRHSAAYAVWRAMVCANHFAFAATAAHAPEDSPELQTPLQAAPWAADTSANEREQIVLGKVAHKMIPSYQEVYPTSCVPAGAAAGTPTEAAQLAEVWWRIGIHHFGQWDPQAGRIGFELVSAWGLNRAASAFNHALVYPTTPIANAARYAYARTLLQQGRATAARAAYRDLLDHATAAANQTKVPADFSQVEYAEDALHGIAESLIGQAADADAAAPYYNRSELSSNHDFTDHVMRGYHSGLEQVQGAQFPTELKTAELYLFVGYSYFTRRFNHAAAATYAAFVQQFPLHPQAAFAQWMYWTNLEPLRWTFRDAARASAAEVQQALLGLLRYQHDTLWQRANVGHPQIVAEATTRTQHALEIGWEEQVSIANQFDKYSKRSSDKGDPSIAIKAAGRSNAEQLSSILLESYISPELTGRIRGWLAQPHADLPTEQKPKEQISELLANRTSIAANTQVRMVSSRGVSTQTPSAQRPLVEFGTLLPASLEMVLRRDPEPGEKATPGFFGCHLGMNELAVDPLWQRELYHAQAGIEQCAAAHLGSAPHPAIWWNQRFEFTSGGHLTRVRAMGGSMRPPEFEACAQQRLVELRFRSYDGSPRWVDFSVHVAASP
jgi:hypothetical protein